MNPARIIAITQKFRGMIHADGTAFHDEIMEALGESEAESNKRFDLILELTEIEATSGTEGVRNLARYIRRKLADEVIPAPPAEGVKS